MTGRPNILFITADDMEGTTPGAFGGQNDVTPALDALAASGAVFERAHVPIAVCQPSRSAMMTGRWPHRNGAEGFEPIDDDVPVLTRLLADVGYRAGILGKVTHLQPVERFEWDHAVDMAELGMGRDPDRYAEEMRAFLEGADDEPWFLMLNAHDPHRPFHGAEDVGRFFSDQQQEGIPSPSRIFSPGEAESVPGYLPDLPEVRREYAQYLSSARRCDDVVAAALRVLEDTGTSEDTVVVFLSDNGMAFPFSKANCYLQSTRTPLIVRWPGSVAPGTRVESAFVSMLDLFATFCDITGATATPNDGSSLVPLLTGTTEQHRDHVVTVFHETAAKKRYEMRCVQDGTHGYIWNGWADGETEYRAENMIGLTWNAMVEAARDDTDLASRVAFYQSRRTEELYELVDDPHALHDLSGDPNVRPVLTGMREALRAWMVETADPQLAAFDASLRG
ncbi:sulfatase family protein [Microbacterium sp.]|uniref:sulfatase family protein n=1 Tax=Microbacterium sp. TaxID=51671 RepID=UPI003F9917D0